MDIRIEGFAISLLIFFSVQDIRSREISLRGLVIFLLMGVIIAIRRNGWTALSWCGDIFPGISFLLIARFSREAVGYGDGLVILILGLVLGGKKAVPILLAALFLVILWGGIRAVRSHVSWKTGLPFVPFLLMADVIRIIAEQIM